MQTLTVKQAVSEFYKKNDFGEDGGISKNYALIKFGFFSIPIPNFESRKNNVYFHDVHHLISENGTNWKGESAVAAWEVASGGWGKFYIPWLLTLWAMGLGIVFYSNSTIAAFKKGLLMNNMISSDISKIAMDKITVNELRNLLTRTKSRERSLLAWILASLGVFFLPFIVGFGVFFVVLKFV